MTASLEDVPNELFEAIAIHLDLADLCSLRLCSRTSALKTTQDHFKSFFVSKQVELTASRLDGFTTVTRDGSLGCLIQDLVLVGLVNCTSNPMGQDDDPGQTQALTAGLMTALRNLKHFGPRKRLRSLTLELRVSLDDPDQILLPRDAIKIFREHLSHDSRETAKAVWRAAGRLWHVALDALREAELPILALHVFDGQDMGICSLAASELHIAGLSLGQYDIALASLETLSMSLSTIWIPDYSVDESIYDYPPSTRVDIAGEETPSEDEEIVPSEEEIAQQMAHAQASSNYDGLAHLLAHCPRLRELELHYLRLRPHELFRDIRMDNKGLFREVALLDTLPRLQLCTIRGFTIDRDDLSVFIRRSRVRRLRMQHLGITGGPLRPVMDYLTSSEAELEELYCSELSDPDMIEFEDASRADAEHTRGYEAYRPLSRSHVIHKMGAEVSRPIAYGYRPDREAVDSPSTRERRTATRREYGPL